MKAVIVDGCAISEKRKTETRGVAGDRVKVRAVRPCQTARWGVEFADIGTKTRGAASPLAHETRLLLEFEKTNPDGSKRRDGETKVS